jgi:hypothetical protein
VFFREKNDGLVINGACAGAVVMDERVNVSFKRKGVLK